MLCLGGLFFALVLQGCSGHYRTVVLHEVVDVESEMGKAAGLEKKEFIAFHEVIERSPNVKSVTRMTNLKDVREPGAFTVSPDGKWLVFSAYETDSYPTCYNLWRVPASGGASVTKLTAGRYMDIEPNYDRAGGCIYFASNRSSNQHCIWRVNASGAGGITRVTGSGSMDRWPCAEPSGREVYFTSKPTNAVLDQIWKIGAEGNLPTQLREGWRPRISPDGNRLLYCQVDPKTKKYKIWVMNCDGTNQTQLTTDVKHNQTHPSWTPDGRRILFASDEGKDSNEVRNYDIWMMNADGSNSTQLTTNGSTDLLPLCDKDGRYVYFLSNRGFNWEIWRMEVVVSALGKSVERRK